MAPQEITSARWKTILYLVVSLLFVACGLLALQEPQGDVAGLQLGMVFFGLCAAIFTWMLIRPQRLLLDSEGFTLVGGLVRSPEKVRWSDIEGFIVYRLPRAGKMIGYNYRPGMRPPRPMAKLTRWLGADAALPKGWPKSVEKMVEELNSYREQAAGRRYPGTFS